MVEREKKRRRKRRVKRRRWRWRKEPEEMDLPNLDEASKDVFDGSCEGLDLSELPD